jgi:hypothetical protein
MGLNEGKVLLLLCSKERDVGMGGKKRKEAGKEGGKEGGKGECRVSRRV